MKIDFELQDYFNYIISGFLWIILFSILIYEFYNNNFFNLINDVGFVLSLFVILLSYIIGNLFRPFDFIIIILTKSIWGNFYEQALYCDKKNYRNILKKVCCKYYAFFEPSSINGKTSNLIIEELKRLNLFNNDYKKSQFIMAEDYLIFNYDKLKFYRLKNLKNFFESIFMPIILILIFTNYKMFSLFQISIYSISFLLISIYLLIIFVNRYKYLKFNYIKDVYRYFVFHKNN